MAARRKSKSPTSEGGDAAAQAVCEHDHLCLMSKREMFCKLCKVPMEKWRGDYRPKVKGATDYEEDD